MEVPQSQYGCGDEQSLCCWHELNPGRQPPIKQKTSIHVSQYSTRLKANSVTLSLSAPSACNDGLTDTY